MSIGELSGKSDEMLGGGGGDVSFDVCCPGSDLKIKFLVGGYWGVFLLVVTLNANMLLL